MALIFLDNVCVNTTARLSRTATILPLSSSDKEKICSKLRPNDYSYLTLQTTGGAEIIRVSCANGEVSARRAQGGTDALTAPTGACLCFKINQLVLDEYTPRDLCEPTIVTETPKFIEIIEPEEGECKWTVNVSQEFIDRMNACCPEDECGTCTVPDGVYMNATITVTNGRVCHIANGRNIVYTAGSCCDTRGTTPL